MSTSETPPPIDAAPGLPVFDASVLGAMFGNEPALIASVLQTFAAGTRSNLADLALANAAQDLNAIAALAHKVAGASRMSGALALGDCAGKLEQAAKQCDAEALSQAVADLAAQWALTQAAIAQRLDLP